MKYCGLIYGIGVGSGWMFGNNHLIIGSIMAIIGLVFVYFDIKHGENI